MTDILKSIRMDDPDPNHLDRREELRDWNRDKAVEIAHRFGVELSAEHWMVITYLRRTHLDRGIPHEARRLAANLDAAFIDQGGMRWLYGLFPGGPVVQGCAIAGVPIPEHSSDDASGTRF